MSLLLKLLDQLRREPLPGSHEIVLMWYHYYLDAGVGPESGCQTSRITARRGKYNLLNATSFGSFSRETQSHFRVFYTRFFKIYNFFFQI